VTDKDGLRVSRLEPKNFRLLIDGEEVPIEYFTEIRDGKVIPSAIEVPELADAESVGTNFLIFIDEFFPLSNDKKRVLAAVAERAMNMRPEDRAAVVAWDGRKLVMLSDWTSSPAETTAAVEGAMERPSGGLHREMERSQWLYRPTATGVRVRRRGYYGARYRLGPQEEQYASRLVAQLRSAVGAASAALRGMETPPGRKAMILLSGGWPWDPAQWVAESYRRMISHPLIPRGAELYGPLSDTANLLGYTIYAVDVPGLQATGGVDASLRAPRPAGSDFEFFLEQEIHDSLQFLADESGGRALINGQRISAFDEVVGDVRSYYWIGFSPDWARDNERHEIRLEVDHEDLSVRARQGFPDLSPQSQTALAVQSSLLFGKAGGSDALQVKLGEAQKGKKGKLNVPVTISIAASELVAVERDGQWVSEVDLFIAAMDEGGGLAEVPPIPLVFSSSRRPKANDKFIYNTTLIVRKKTTELAIAVYDRNGDKRLTRVLVKGKETQS
ncbi:MAG: VWA domain-containing protein, partial [Thermoanaerobaculia bacterium]